MEKLRRIFNGVEDPRTSNATRHDFHEMLAVSVLSSLCGGQICVDMADFAKNNEGVLRRFMPPEHGPPSHDAFSRLFRMLDPVPFAADWVKALEEEGVRRRTFSKASELSPLHLAIRRPVVSIVRPMDDKLSIRRRLLRAAQAPDCRLELIANAAKLAEKL